MVQFPTRCRSVLSLSLMSILCANVRAAEPISLQHTSFSQVKHWFNVQVPGLVKGSQSGDTLKFLKQHTDSKHINHVRMQQFYSGFPVAGGYAVLHGKQSAQTMLAEKNQLVSMNGTIYQGLSADLGRPAPDFADHGQEALQHFKSQYIHRAISHEKVAPMVYIDENHRGHWAYQVSLLITDDAKIPERPTAIVDAQTYESFVKWNDIKNARAKVSGRGFGGNVHVGSYMFGENYPKLQLTRDNKTGVCYMENERTKVVDMMHRYEGRNSPMHFMCPDSAVQSDGSYMTGYRGNGFDKINGAYSPSNDALYAGNIIYNMYSNWYGMVPLEKNGRAKSLIMRVHFGMQFDNAFWDGTQMTFGDGGRDLYPLVSLGVGAHEISHGFTENNADLAYYGQSGGMNESFSDMASQAAENYATGKNSWTIGAEIVKESSRLKAFRYMDKPSRDGMSIDHASQYTSDMDVHHSSGVYNRLFYLLSTQPGWSVRDAFQVMVTANTDYWTPTSTFDEGACGIINAAKSFNYSIPDVKGVLDQVGIHYSECYEDKTEQS